MARIAGIDIPPQKRVVISLTYITGIGDTTAQKLVKTAGINPATRVKDLSDFLVTEVLDPCRGVDARGLDQLLGGCVPDAGDVGEGDDHALLRRYVDAGDSRHLPS